jgi:membrane-bound metal-dependent hydrolase YbcI (DUF457 family)
MVVGAALPDVDYALVWAPQFNAWHRVITHNVAFVVVVAGAGALVAPKRAGHRGEVAAALAVGGLTHLITDSMLDTNPTNGIGVAWGWPLWDIVWSPLNLATIRDNPAGWADPVEAAKGVADSLLWEVPVWLIAGVLCWRSRRRRAPTTV